MANYINRKGQGYTETVDETETLKEAKRLLAEYIMADSSGYYYISSRACKGWN